VGEGREKEEEGNRPGRCRLKIQRGEKKRRRKEDLAFFILHYMASG